MSTMVGTKAQMQISGEAHFLEETMNPAKVKQMHDAPKDYEKAKGMKWLLAMMSKVRARAPPPTRAARPRSMPVAPPSSRPTGGEPSRRARPPRARRVARARAPPRRARARTRASSSRTS